jgi:hypothetical protein
MAVLSMERISSQSLAGLQISLDNGQAIESLNDALTTAPAPANQWTTDTETGVQYTGGMQVTFSYPGIPDQVGLIDDWILVTDASYDAGTNVWTLAGSSTITVYGVNAGLIGTVTDFVNTFTGDTPIVWSATSEAPIASAAGGGTATLLFDPPVSPDGPFSYTVEFDDTTTSTTGAATLSGAPVILGNGQVRLTVTGLTVGDDVEFTVTVTSTTFTSTNAVALVSNSITVT